MALLPCTGLTMSEPSLNLLNHPTHEFQQGFEVRITKLQNKYSTNIRSFFRTLKKQRLRRASDGLAHRRRCDFSGHGYDTTCHRCFPLF